MALRIQVSENGSLKVDLTMPAPCAGRLYELIPAQWEPVAQTANVDLRALSQAVEHTQFAPRELFTLTAGPKSVRAWLE